MEQFHRLYKTMSLKDIMDILVTKKYATPVSKATLRQKHKQLGY